MDFRLVLAASISLAGLAGCVASADSGLDSNLLTAADALEAAREVVPDGELIGIHGVEGAQPERIAGDVPIDDGADDGRLGDGRLSAWVVTFAVQDALAQVRVHANGSEPVRGTEPLPPGFAQQDGATDASGRHVDSDEAAQIALVLPEFAQHLTDYSNGGFAYFFVPYGRQYPVRDWSTGMFLSYEQMETIGWAVGGNTWSVVHYDPAAWTDDEAPTTAHAVLDAATGKPLEMTISVARTILDLLDGEHQFSDPVPPTGLDPYVHQFPFTLPPGTGSLTGVLITYHSGLFGTQAANDYPVYRFVAPDGSIAFEGGGDFGFDEVALLSPTAGQWTIELTHGTPLPATMTLTGFLWATVPLQT